jgi:hypothetical protein
MDDIRGMGLKPRDPDGAGRSLSCASSRLLQYLSANLLPACGPGVYGWCCVLPPVHNAVHDRRSFPVHGCSSLSWYFLPDYSQVKSQYFQAGFTWEIVLFPVPVHVRPGRRIQREKCSVDIPSAGLSRLPGVECLAVPRIAAGPTL